MQSRMHSLRKTMIVRLSVLAVVLALLVGGTVFIREKIALEDAIADRTRIVIELLKQRVIDSVSSTQKPWQTLVQDALDDLGRISPQSNLGHFAWASIQNIEGEEIGSLAVENIPGLEQLIEEARQQAQPTDDNPVVLPLAKIDSRYSFAIGLRLDYQGETLAQLRGLYVITPEVMRDFWLGIARSVGASMLIVFLVSALHYPVLRRLVDGLGKLSINLLDANLETLQGFGSAIAKRDSDTDAHNFRVTIYAVKLAESMGLNASMIRTLIKGAFLHDVGKIGIRDHILLKPGRLDPDEFEIMKTHVRHGLDIVNNCHWLRDASEVVGNHHEKFDGSGYYQALKGEDIPITARIFAIVDVFDALTSERPYKKPLSLEEAMDIVLSGAGQHFDPEVLQHFDSIALSLHQDFAHDENRARSELAQIIRHYFKGDIGDLL